MQTIFHSYISSYIFGLKTAQPLPPPYEAPDINTGKSSIIYGNLVSIHTFTHIAINEQPIFYYKTVCYNNFIPKTPLSSKILILWYQIFFKHQNKSLSQENCVSLWITICKLKINRKYVYFVHIFRLLIPCHNCCFYVFYRSSRKGSSMRFQTP